MEERVRALLRVTITAKAACAAQAPVECAWRARATDVSEVQTSDPPEHIIPDAMGGTLKTDRVCRECNGRAGSDIDGPFMQDWLIAMDRVIHEEIVSIGASYHKPPAEGDAPRRRSA